MSAVSAVSDAADRLRLVLEDAAAQDTLAVAVSGGVDSLTLMAFAHAALGATGLAAAAPRRPRVRALHAVSAAVPPAATARVQSLATAHSWHLTLIDAGETRDEEYLRNPADRCRVCKSHLYDAMRDATQETTQTLGHGTVLLSGTNLDDLDDHRPGLEAARERGVRHPFVEAGMDKRAVRALARRLGLDDVAELPAQPCLASRVETGLRIRPELLSLVNTLEDAVRASVGAAATVRCRVRAAGVVVELDAAALEGLDDHVRSHILDQARDTARHAGIAGDVALAPYRMGSAFLRVL